MSADRAGFRGYLASRPVRGSSYPQRVQNVLIRTYAQRRGLTYKLSLTEYAMPGCFMMLETLLAELPKLEGIIVFSMFMLPPDRNRRARMYRRIVDMGVELHAALEETVLRSANDLAHFEDTIEVASALQRAPLRGRFHKDGMPFPPGDAFVTSLRGALATSAIVGGEAALEVTPALLPS